MLTDSTSSITQVKLFSQKKQQQKTIGQTRQGEQQTGGCKRDLSDIRLNKARFYDMNTTFQSAATTVLTFQKHGGGGYAFLPFVSQRCMHISNIFKF